MSRKLNIKNILNGILNSFISRNNDVNGYLGIGKIYTLMINKKVNEVEIDLINKNISPKEEEFYYRISCYSQILFDKLKGKDVDGNFLKSVKIIASCNNLNVDKRLLNTIYLKIIAIDVNNKEYAIQNVVSCRKYDPKSELKSTRTYEN